MTEDALFAFAEDFCRLYEDLSIAVKTLINYRDILKIFLEQIDRNVKGDYVTKLAVLFTGISAYLKEPLNLFLRGDSGLGKTYNTVKVLEYFPEEDVLFLGGISPTALIHDYGVKMSATGINLDKLGWPDKPERRMYDDIASYRDAIRVYKEALQQRRELEVNSYTLIELSSKILVFLETPHLKTFNILRPILSHDKERMSFKITDKTSEGKLKTKHIILQGFPAAIFLKATDEYAEELATRSFTVSPQRCPEKFRAANQLTDVKANAPWYDAEQAKTRMLFREAMNKIKQISAGKDVIIPFDNLSEFYPAEIPRDMRDYAHLTQLTKCITALHAAQRLTAQKQGFAQYLVASAFDVKVAWQIYTALFETTRTGVSEHLLQFYHDIIVYRDKWRVDELVTEYNNLYKPKIASKTIYRMLSTLEQLGYVSWVKSETDARVKLYSPLIKQDEKMFSNLLFDTERIFSAANFENKLDLWLSRYSRQLEFSVDQKNLSPDEKLEEIKKYTIKNTELCPYLTDVLTSLKHEKKPETILKDEKGITENNSSLNPPKQILSVIYLDKEDCHMGKCGLCNQHRLCDTTVTYIDQTWGDICSDCAQTCFEQLKKQQEALLHD